MYPELVRVPGYPVYYAPALSLNYFHYDGMYWVFADDNWYVAYWYNGPWYMVYPDYVPLFLLRVPVYYYRRPPAYFHGWWLGAPPRAASKDSRPRTPAPRRPPATPAPGRTGRNRANVRCISRNP